MIDTGMILDS